MNSSTHSHHYPPNPNEIAGNRRPARPTSAQLRSTTPTRNRPQANLNSSRLNTTAKLEQSMLRHDLDRTTTSINSQKLNGKGKNRLYSTWTPLQDEETNARLFDERRQLVNKWFEKWTDDQRRMILDDIMVLSRPRQLTYTRSLVTKRFPAHHQDFTRVFPRVLCLYIFSFLDPRSLCRAGQVCWYWKFLSESDQIWMPKCLRFGWTPKHSPSPFESNVWKRVYSFNIQALQTMPVKDYSHQSVSGYFDDQLSSRQNTTRSQSVRQHHSSTPHRRLENPPWRANSRNPADTLRYNYLDNDDSALETLIARHRKYGSSTLNQSESDHEYKSSSKDRQARHRNQDNPEQTGRKRRSQSLSARGSPSVSFRDEHTSRNSHQNHSYLTRTTPSNQHRPPVDIPRPPSSAQKSRYHSKTSTNDAANRTWHSTNNHNDDYIYE